MRDFEAASPAAHAHARRREAVDFIGTTKMLTIHQWLKAWPPLVLGARSIRVAEQVAGCSFCHQSFFKCTAAFLVLFFSARPTAFLFGLLIVGNAVMLMLPVINHN